MQMFLFIQESLFHVVSGLISSDQDNDLKITEGSACINTANWLEPKWLIHEKLALKEP